MANPVSSTSNQDLLSFSTATEVRANRLAFVASFRRTSQQDFGFKICLLRSLSKKYSHRASRQTFTTFPDVNILKSFVGIKDDARAEMSLVVIEIYHQKPHFSQLCKGPRRSVKDGLKAGTLEHRFEDIHRASSSLKPKIHPKRSHQ